MKKFLLSCLTVVLAFTMFSSTALANENTDTTSYDNTYEENNNSYVSPDDLLETGVGSVLENGDIITEEEEFQDVEESSYPVLDENGNVVEDIIDEDSSVEEEPSFGVMRLWYTTQNMGKVGKSYGSWRTGVSGSGPARLTLSKSVNVSNTYSGTLTASKKAVSGSVGFDISKGHTTTASYSVNVPKGKKYKIQFRAVYTKYKVKQMAYSNSTYLQTKYVYPQKYSHLEYRWVKA